MTQHEQLQQQIHTLRDAIQGALSTMNDDEPNLVILKIHSILKQALAQTSEQQED